ncbi:ABC transporter ATP-binding protein [Saxibacter everestensis]|uniref:ABC transporter ATP-binding protein n=1 Tax=Saxibacter everestensis TaxID=2909229 RepID=A0ABY8QSZ5_9MICO|nr:ABC transporter ATP-binding protein [Brevibacteriaceae bacterium ZFBP1038]
MSVNLAGAGTRIDIQNVTKRYPTSIAVDDITLRIEPGEFITLLGPSGSGKTTTLNLIAGFTDLSAGSVEIDGVRVDDVPAHKRGLGVVFQHYALFPHMSVAQNLAFPLQQRKIPKSTQADLVRAALETVGLKGYDDRFPRELSGGQQQRVAFARAMVFSPRALLMDEPLGALDKNLRERLQLEIKRIHQEVGRTFVFVTHDQEEALILSDRIAIFNEGRIEQVGASAELYETPTSLFVAEFMGESTVLRADVNANGHGWSMDFAGTTIGGTRPSQIQGPGAFVLRPEQLRVAANQQEVPFGADSVPVTVVQNIYLGSGHKYELRLADGSTGIVRSPREMSVDVRPGDDAFVYWAGGDGVLLEDTRTPAMA